MQTVTSYAALKRMGDKISQLLILPVILVDCELAEELDAGERGDNGFGSSGR